MSGSNVYVHIRPALLCPLAIFGGAGLREAGFQEAGFLGGGGGGTVRRVGVSIGI